MADDAQSSPQAADDLAVLTWNVHGLPLHDAPARLGRIAAWIAARQPDLVLLQEVWSGAYARALSGALAGRYEACFSPHPFTRRPRGGLMILVREASGWRAGRVRFEPFRAAAAWYRLNEGDGVAGKGMLAMEVRRGERALTVVNTHVQAQYLERAYTDVRREQLAQLAEFLDRVGRGTAMVFGGDLNTEAGEDLYRTHLAVLGTDLAAAERAARGGTTCFDRKGGRSEWIDYVFARDLEVAATLEKVESSGPDDPYSDHDGLLFVLGLGPSPAPPPRRHVVT